MIAALIALTNQDGQVTRVLQVNDCAVSVSSVFGDCAEAYEQLAQAGCFIQSLNVDGEFVACGEPVQETVLFESYNDFVAHYANAIGVAELIWVVNGLVDSF